VNLPDFFAAWDIIEGDALWRAPAQRARIW